MAVYKNVGASSSTSAMGTTTSFKFLRLIEKEIEKNIEVLEIMTAYDYLG